MTWPACRSLILDIRQRVRQDGPPSVVGGKFLCRFFPVLFFAQFEISVSGYKDSHLV